MRRFGFPSTTHYRWLAGLWTLGIVVALSLPPSSFSGAQPGVGADKVVHVLLFAGFAGLWMRGLCPPDAGGGAQCRLRMIGLLAVGALFAVGSELYQDLLPIRRSGDPYDAVADGAGLLLGVLLYAVWWRIRGPSAAPRKSER